MGRERIKTLASPEETIEFGKEIASKISFKNILALKGDLGAGKTTFVQGLLQGFGILDTAQSPTFTYLQIYEGAFPIYHFDLYRLSTERDFVLLGFEEYFSGEGLVILEWPEKIASLIPDDAWLIELSYADSGRIAEICSWGDR